MVGHQKISIWGLVFFACMVSLACSQRNLGIFLYETQENIDNYAQRDTIKTEFPQQNNKNLINTNYEKQTIISEKKNDIIKEEKKDILSKTEIKNIIDTQKISYKTILTDTQRIITNQNIIPQDKKNQIIAKNNGISPQKLAFIMDSIWSARERNKNFINPQTNPVNPSNINPNFYPNPLFSQEKPVINNYYNYPNPKDSLKTNFIQKKSLDSLKLVVDSLKKSLILLKNTENTQKKDTILLKKDSVSKKIPQIDTIRTKKDTLSGGYAKKDSIFVKKDTLLSPKNTLKNGNPPIYTEKIIKKPQIDSLKITAYYEIDEIQPLHKIELLKKLDNLKNIRGKLLEIRISGYTDRQGRAEINQKLSQNRVFLIKEYLIGKNIDEKVIFMQYFGQKYASKEINPNERRVEILAIFSDF